MISAVIITLNESRNIARCLSSIQGLVEEIIVVDSGSTDDTKWICQQFGVRWVEQLWRGYGSQKNAGNALASHPYILSLDADEAISERLRCSIMQVKPQLDGVYSMNRRTNYCGTWISHSGWYPDKKIRLFPRDCVGWDHAGVHERLVIPQSLSRTHLAGDLLHFSYDSLEDHRDRQEHYATLQARDMVTNNKPVHLWHLLIKPIYTFFRVYLLRSGWRDGKAGWQIARISAWATRRRFLIAKEERAKKIRSQSSG